MHIHRRSSWNSELPMKILIWESQAVERMRRRLIAICGGSSACFSGVLEIMECCWGCQLACCHEASLCHQTVSGKPAHGIIAHIPNKNHLVFLHYESWRAADFLSKAQTSRVSPDWLWWGHSWVSLRRVADSRMGSVYLRLFSFLQSFWLAHMNTSHDLFQRLWLKNTWFTNFPYSCYLFSFSRTDDGFSCYLSVLSLLCPVDRNGTLFFLEARTELWGSLLIVFSHV